MPLTLRIDNRTDLPAEGREHTFVACGGSIGRAPDSDWILPDERRYVSSRHAVIDFQAGAYYLVDTSRNGVFVNGAGTAIGQGHPQRLFHGDRLRIGTLQIAVELTADAPAPHDAVRGDVLASAQLVAEDPSLELLLVSEEQLIGMGTLQRHLAPGTALVRQITPSAAPRPVPAGGAAAIAVSPGPGADPGCATTSDADLQGAVALLLDAAGISAASLAGMPSASVLEAAGRALRVVIDGAPEPRMPGSGAGTARHNPLRLAPEVAAVLASACSDDSGTLPRRQR